MNQRRGAVNRRGGIAAAVVVVLIVAVGCVYWFAIRDGESSDTPGATGTPTATPTTAQIFALAGVPFTFQYPATFAQGDAATGFVWIAGVSPVDILDIRRVGEREYSTSGLTTLMTATLRAQKGVKVVGSGTDTVGGQKVVTFTVQSGTTTPLQSKLVFFSRAGSTWQFECQSQASNRATIEAGCAQALATLTFS